MKESDWKEIKGLEFWDTVQKSDLNALGKKVKINGQLRTPIFPYHMFKAATERWGPEGGKWGLKPLDGSTDYIRFTPNGLMAFFVGQLYSPLGCIPIFNSIKLASQAGMPNDDWAMILRTGAVKKGLSYWGFNADVYLKMLDDEKYVQDLVKEDVRKKNTDAAKDTARIAHINELKTIMGSARAIVEKDLFNEVTAQVTQSINENIFDTSYDKNAVQAYINRYKVLMEKASDLKKEEDAAKKLTEVKTETKDVK